MYKICVRRSAEVAVSGRDWPLEKSFEFASLNLLMDLRVEIFNLTL